MFMSDRNMCDIIIVILMYRATSEKEFTLNVHKKLIKTNKNKITKINSLYVML